MKCSLMSLIPGHIGQQELFYLLIHFLYFLLLNGVEIGEIRENFLPGFGLNRIQSSQQPMKFSWNKFNGGCHLMTLNMPCFIPHGTAVRRGP